MLKHQIGKQIMIVSFIVFLLMNNEYCYGQDSPVIILSKKDTISITQLSVNLLLDYERFINYIPFEPEPNIIPRAIDEVFYGESRMFFDDLVIVDDDLIPNNLDDATKLPIKDYFYALRDDYQPNSNSGIGISFKNIQVSEISIVKESSQFFFIKISYLKHFEGTHISYGNIFSPQRRVMEIWVFRLRDRWEGYIRGVRNWKKYDQNEDYRKPLSIRARDNGYQKYGDLAYLKFNTHQYPSSRRYFQLALAFKQTNEYRIKLEEVESIINEINSRKRYLEKLWQGYYRETKLNPSNPELYFELAESIWNISNLDSIEEVVRNLRKCINLAYKHVPAYFLLGKVYTESTNFNKALENYRLLLKYDPFFEEAWLKIADIHRLKENLTEEKNALSEYLKLNPTDINILNRYADLVLNEGNYTSAYELLLRALEINPNDPRLYLKISEVCVKIYKLNTGFQFRQKAFTINPKLQRETLDKEKTNFNLGLIKYRRKEYVKAIEYLDASYYSHPEESLILKGEILRSFRNGLNRSEWILNKVRTDFGPSPELFFQLGITSKELGKFDNSIKYFENAIELSQRDRVNAFDSAYFELSDLYFELGKNYKAKEVIISLIDLKPQKFHAHYKLMLIEDAEDNFGQVIFRAEKLIRNDFQFPFMELILARAYLNFKPRQEFYIRRGKKMMRSLLNKGDEYEKKRAKEELLKLKRKE